METTIRIFESVEFGQIRTALSETGEPLFCGKDVATALGYTNPAKAIRDHCKGVNETFAPSNGGSQVMKFIPEADVYRLVMRSKLPDAEKFKDWVCEKVLPQIRKTGGFVPVSEQDDEKTIMAKAILIMQRTIEQKNALLAEQRPKVLFAEAVTACDDSILIRDLAKLLTQNGIVIGQNRLFGWLRQHGYLFKRENRPTQRWVEKGIFETNINLIDTYHGTKEKCVTKITGKGQRYFIDGFLTGRLGF